MKWRIEIWESCSFFLEEYFMEWEILIVRVVFFFFKYWLQCYVEPYPKVATYRRMLGTANFHEGPLDSFQVATKLC